MFGARQINRLECLMTETEATMCGHFEEEEEEEEARRDAHPLCIRTTSEGSVQGETTVRIHRMIVRGNDDSRGW